MRQNLTSGETVFFDRSEKLWDMRKAAKQALRDDAPKTRFVVTMVVDYYANMLEQLFLDAEESMENALELGEQIVGEEDGAWRCAALWSLNSGTGVLLHREGSKLYYAYIPLMTKEAAEWEHIISLSLSQLAKEAKDTPIQLERALPAGQHRLYELLEILSEEIEV